jgi:WhiB family redox-sensing transcriptional regulator
MSTGIQYELQGDAIVGKNEFDWRSLGACRGLDAEIFYPEDEEEGGEAKAICAECHVCTACLEHAISRREKTGVWGGLNSRERRRLIRQRRRSA